MAREALNLSITGIVQGVGFRPFVYREAQRHHLAGWVLNDVEGVKVHAEGEPDALDRFTVTLSECAPAAAQVRQVDIAEAPVEGFTTFEIRFSKDAQPDETTLVSPDLATCDECIKELFDPQDRRYRYPFINCTNCGPRFTIMNGLPYDRPATSMAPFVMCPECQAEYDDPANRRFHAQPDACFECGPRLGFVASGDVKLEPVPLREALAHRRAGYPERRARLDEITWATDREESDLLLARACMVLRGGGIVAVKGLGGYHLACDAWKPAAISRLRRRKHRPGKPLAVMFRDMDAVRAVCEVSAAEERQLTLPARPIVLLRKRPGARIAEGLADGLLELGAMLPATPVQHLLLHDYGRPLVMTSGNVHGEPICTTEAASLDRLGGVADAFLVNDRAICGRYDDSVVRVLDAGPSGEVVQMVRRARGFAPLPIALPDAAAECPTSVLAVGPEQKNTFTLTRGASAFVSQHIGDMENAPVSDAWHETRQRFEEMFRMAPKALARDRHPEYLTSKWAHEQDMPCIQVQHHHAHILSVMGENNLGGPVAGFAFDGTGFGLDGAIWGGEVLLCNLSAFERFANFAYFPLPGGAAAIREPVRIAYGLLWASDLLKHPAAQRFVDAQVPDAALYAQMIEKGLNCPNTSSVGRLFDAASALLGICEHPTYEGEAAVLLEAAAWQPCEGTAVSGGSYRFDLLKNAAAESSTAADTSVLLIDPAPVFAALLDDLAAGVPVPLMARRFHDAFVQVILDVAELIRAAYGIETVALAGGVFMNRYLIEHALVGLQAAGLTVALNQDLPPNDGSVSFGQAVLACATKPEE